MEKRKVKEISTKTFHVLIGIMIMLVSISLCLNTGYFAKGLSFPFAYFLGMGSYLFYAFLFVEGLFLIIKGGSVPFRISKYLWFGILLGIGTFALLTYFAVDQSEAYLSFANGNGQMNVFTKLNSVFNGLVGKKGKTGYFQSSPFLIFFGDAEFGCGLLGYTLLALGNSAFSNATGGLVLAICLTATGFLLFAIPLIIDIVKSCKKAKKEKKEAPKVDINSHKRIKNINIIKGAKNIDPKTYHTEVSGAGKNLGRFDEAEPKEEEMFNENFPALPFSQTAFSQETLEEHIKEVDPAIESLDEFKEVIFDASDLTNDPNITNLMDEEKYEPIEEIPQYDEKENIFKNARKEENVVNKPFFKNPINEEPNEVFSNQQKQSFNNFVEEPVRESSFDAQNPLNDLDNFLGTKPVEQPQPFVEQRPVEQPKPFVQPKPFEQPKAFEQRPVEQPKVYEQPKPVEEPKPAQTPRKPRVNFSVLNSELLDTYETAEAAEANARVAFERRDIINNTFKDFNVGAEVVDYTIGPSVTRFNIRYNSNVSVRSVANLVQDISIRLNGVSARFESVIEGQSTSGLEIPNEQITTVSFKDVYDALPSPKKHPMAVAFGKNIKGDVVYADYDEFPHMLVSGTTGSGKSVFVNSIICTLIMRNSPDDLKLVLVDPKKVEMSRYADMPHLLCPIITEPPKVKLVLDKLVDEMEYRYSLFAKNNATNIKEFNEDCEFNGNERMPYIVVILDEYADLVDQCKDISYPVVMLAQKARACGIHLMVSTQRPSTNVVTGVIKANMPTHVALMTANSVDSITIIGEGGAEKLLGKGDMLVQSPLVSRVGVCRLQSCFINRHEIIRLVTDLKSKYPTNFDPDFMNLEEKVQDVSPADIPDCPENDEETKYRFIKDWVMAQEYMSMSKIQRECSVGFNRAGRFFNRLIQEGVVAPTPEGSKGCKVILQNKFGDIDDDDVIATSEDNSYIKK